MVLMKKIELIDKKKEIEEVISRGGQVPSDNKSKSEKEDSISICLRMPKEFLLQVDLEVKKRVGMNRTAWILEAIQEKLERRN